MPVTMKDIAKKVGVARTTVSMVLNNNPASYVSKAKREKILETAREMKYRPNFQATSLRAGKTDCIGLFCGFRVTFDSFSTKYHLDVSAGIQQAIEEAGNRHSLVMYGPNLYDNTEVALSIVRRGMVDGLVIISLSITLPHLIENVLPQLDILGVPYVVVHSTTEEFSFNSVGMDTFKGGYLAGGHLAKLGYKECGFFMFRDTTRLAEVLAGFKQGLADNGVTFNDENLIRPLAAPETPGGMDKIIYEKIKVLPDLPRALFVPSDVHAANVMAAVKDRGLRVPEDIALIGYDDVYPDGPWGPGLTTIHHPFREKGVKAYGMLKGLLDGSLDKKKVHREILEPSLVVRVSSGN